MRLLLPIFGGSITSIVLGADWWIVALAAATLTFAAVLVELLRLRRAIGVTQRSSRQPLRAG
jgi:hypothetical protein